MLFYLFDAKFTGLKFYRWRYDNWPIGQWVIFLVAPDTAYVNHFFPQLDLESSSLARPLATSCIEARFAHFEELIRGRLFSKSLLKRTKNGFCNTLEAKCFNLVSRAVSPPIFQGKSRWGWKFFAWKQTDKVTSKTIRTISNFTHLIQFHLIWQILATFSLGHYLKLSKFRKRERQFLLCSPTP